MGLKACTRKVETLDSSQRESLLRLMEQHYDNVRAKEFFEDLDDKDHVILLKDRGIIHGFSTLKILRMTHQGVPIVIVYSGDTIIERSRWGSMALPLEFIRYVLWAAEENCCERAYWLLTTKGPRTYRCLPVFFDDYYPHHSEATPGFEGELLLTLGRTLFGGRYDPERGVLTADAMSQRLKSEHADIPAPYENNPDISFFLWANPDFRSGEELVCLADCSAGNVKDFAVARALR